MRTDLSTVVTKQLPEFIREDYPTFVAFVQAYYDWLKQQEIISFYKILNKYKIIWK